MDMRDDVGMQVLYSSEQQEAVLEEMNRILADPAFNGSKRCIVLFRYLVNAALRGDHSEFKERILGVEVFGRNPTYDSQADPIVRVTANEIRKRLGQCYYEEQGGSHGVRIRLVRGGYIPEFDFKTPDEVEEPKSVKSFSVAPQVQRESKPSHPDSVLTWRAARGKIWLPWIAASLLLLVASITLYRHSAAGSTLNVFWAPLWQTDQTIVVCVADNPSQSRMTRMEPPRIGSTSNVVEQSLAGTGLGDFVPATPFVEWTAATQISNLLVSHAKKVFIQRASTAALHQFRQGPTILIGGSDNPWSLMLLSSLRYTVETDATTHETWIRDAANPSKRDWLLGPGLRFEDSYIDYAIISRFWDRETENWIVAISSPGPHGTRAASELITDPSYIKAFPSAIKSHGNLQIVVKTSVINGTSGPPQVQAAYYW